ncbi:MAG TPA: TRAP transporter small permease [Hyphomicrobiaceae bacterium]|nr:TRAP transporter small permease [Hyphomicrobiaceae bacterium]
MAGDAEVGHSPNRSAPGPIRILLDGIDALCRIDGWMAAVCLALLTLLILAEITVRALSHYFPSVPADIPVAWEYSSYLMAATFTFGAAMTLRSGGHIRVTLLLARLPVPLRRAAEVLVSAAGLMMAGFLTYAMFRFTYEAFSRGQTSISSDTRLWIPQAIVTFGILLLALQFFARFIQALLGLPLEDQRLKVTTLSE